MDADETFGVVTLRIVGVDGERAINRAERLVVLPREKEGTAQAPVAHRVAPVVVDALACQVERFSDLVTDRRDCIQERAGVVREREAGVSA